MFTVLPEPGRWSALLASIYRSRGMRLLAHTVVLGLVTALAGCSFDLEMESACLLGPCGSGYGNVPETFVTGFPYAAVDRSRAEADGGYVGRIGVGDTVSLYLVRAPAASSPTATPPDTLRGVAWKTSDASVASIASATPTQAVLVGRSVGRVRVRANEVEYLMWACEAGGCARVSEIEVAQ